MAVIEAIQFGPVKSMLLAEVPEVSVDSDGLFGDRHHMVVEDGESYVAADSDSGRARERGHFVSLRKDSWLAGIIPLLGPDGLRLTAEGMEDLVVPHVPDIAANRIPVSVWGWRGEAVDMGLDVAEWLSDRAGRPVRLVEISREHPRYVEGDPALGKLGFADGYPVTVGSDKGNDCLDKLLGMGVSSKRRARATLQLSGLVLPPDIEVPDTDFPEDYVKAIRATVDGLSMVLRRANACGRCVETNRHPDTGELIIDSSFLKALGQLGRRGCHANTEKYGPDPELFFTQNFVIELPKDMPPDAVITLRKGMEVDVTYSSHTNWVPLGVQ